MPLADPGLDMLTAAIIAVVSLAALGQFALSYWRGLFLCTATEPLSDSLRAATGSEEFLDAQQFTRLLAMRELCPELDRSRENLTSVRLYYRALAALKLLPMAGLGRWAEAEQALCTRYAAVMLDRRLQASLQLRLGVSQR